MSGEPPLNTPSAFQAHAFLDEQGQFWQADIQWSGGHWLSFKLGGGTTSDAMSQGGYLVPCLPFDLHCHGLNGQDFSESDFFDLHSLNEHLGNEGVFCVPTLFLPKSRLHAFVDFIEAFHLAKTRGD